MHTFAYTRVSTADQNADAQLIEIEAAGFAPGQVYSDTISGRTSADQRPEFAKLLEVIGRTRPPKQLVVTKLDRLGRDTIDVMSTIKRLSEMGCAVRVLQLGSTDLTSSAGKLILSVLASVAEMERDLIVERTRAGLERVRRETPAERKAKGKKAIGRPRVLSAAQETAIKQALGEGEPVAALARAYGVGRTTIARVRDKA